MSTSYSVVMLCLSVCQGLFMCFRYSDVFGLEFWVFFSSVICCEKKMNSHTKLQFEITVVSHLV